MVCVVCGGPVYSKSVEHGGEELCFKHYKQWIKSGKKATIEEME